MPVRMKDIARDLGVSVVTVSKALNNHRDISDATRQRVLRRVRELNYQPNLYAQGLVSGRSFIVGMVVPDLVHAFFSEVARSLSDTIRPDGFGLLIASSDDDAELERQEVEMMVRRRVDALIVASCQTDFRFLKTISEQVPLVLLDRRFDDFQFNFVGTNDILIGEMATEHLIAGGYRRIAHIAGQDVSTSVGRLRGYKKALSRHKLSVRPEYIVKRKHSDESGDQSGRTAMESLLQLEQRPDAVFCFNDPAAIGAMDAILAAGLNIPDDIAVIGAGSIRYANSLRVPLTSIDVSRSALGKNLGKLAIKLISSKISLLPKSILIEPKLMIRESTHQQVDNTPRKARTPSPANRLIRRS